MTPDQRERLYRWSKEQHQRMLAEQNHAPLSVNLWWVEQISGRDKAFLRGLRIAPEVVDK